jgi:hypothetical protein
VANLSARKSLHYFQLRSDAESERKGCASDITSQYPARPFFDDCFIPAGPNLFIASPADYAKKKNREEFSSRHLCSRDRKNFLSGITRASDSVGSPRRARAWLLVQLSLGFRCA